MNQITQNQEGIDLQQVVWVIKEKYGWVFKDKTLGQYICVCEHIYSLSRLFALLFPYVLFIHISGPLFLNVARKSLNWESFSCKLQKIYLKLA